MSAASTLCLKCKSWVDGDIDDHACGRASAPEPDAVASSPHPIAESSRRPKVRESVRTPPASVPTPGAAPLAYDTATVGIVQGQPEQWDELVEAWHHFGREIEHGMWGRVAVAMRVRRIHGESSVELFAEKVGQHPSTVYRLLKVGDAFDVSRRRENLSYWHHVEALRAPNPDEALDAAEAEGWSVRDLRKHLAPPSSSEPKPAPASNPVVDAVEAQQRQPSVDEPDWTRPEAVAREAFDPIRTLFTDEWPEDVTLVPLLREAERFVADLKRFLAAHS